MIFMKNTKKTKHLTRSALILSALLMGILNFSCSNFVERIGEDTVQNASAANSDKAYLSLSLKTNTKASGISRTIIHNYESQISKNDLTNFVLKGIYETGEEFILGQLNRKLTIDLDETDRFTRNIELAPGIWTFTLTAEYLIDPDNPDSFRITYSDTVTNKTINRGAGNSVSFTLKPQGDFGGFEISIDLSSNPSNPNTNTASVDKVKVELRTLAGQLKDSKEWDSAAITGNGGLIKYSYTGNDEDPSIVDPDDLDTQNIIKIGTYLASFEFFTGNDPTPINQWENYIRVTPFTITQANVTLDFNDIYTLTFLNSDGSPFDYSPDNGDLSDYSILTTKFSSRSSFDLPAYRPASMNSKIFLGWKDSGDHLYTKITPNTTNSLTLSPYFVDPVLYVSSTGDDDDLGFTSTTQLETFTKAFEIIETYGNSDLDWTINVSGTIKGGTNGAYAQCLIPESINDKAKSLLLDGANGVDGLGLPQDRIDKGWQSSSGLAGFAVKIDTTVPVTITNLEITKGRGGLYIAQGATVMLGDGVRIIGNNQGANGCGGGVRNEGTLFVYGSAVIGNQNATQAANGNSSDSYIYNYSNPSDTRINANYSIYGAGIYNGTYNSDNTIEAKLYLGYRGFDTDGVTPVEETLTGGIYANSASSGGGIYNDKNCTVYYKSGTIKYNGTSGEGGGIVNYGLFEMCGENAKILNNTASSGGGISNKTTGRFLMSDGQINNNKASSNGGGIYNTGNCYLYGNAVIGDMTASAAASAETYGNYAMDGGGISNSNGNLYVGYKPDGSVDESFTTNGGIYYNYATGTGSSNSHGGGAIYNTGSNGLGKTYLAAGTLAYNSSATFGGGIYILGKLVEISGGIIENNSAANGGGAIFYNSWLHNFAMKGNPSIPKGADNKNDILLTATADITITGNLDASLNSYYLSFSPYNRSAPVLLLGEGSGTTLADAYKKFEIAQPIISDSDGNQHTPHMILTDGNLPNGCYLIEADTWEGDLARYIEEMTASGTVHVGGEISSNLAQTVMTALESKPDDFRLSLDLSKTTGWGDSMPSFEGCTKLKDFVFPNTLGSIRLNNINDGNLFKNCSNLETITIPISVTSIYSSFDGCTSLTDVNYMGTESQKAAKIRFPSLTKNGVPTQETVLQSAQVTWHYLGYGYTITIDTGTDSDIEVSVTDGSSPITDIASINKGTPLTFTVTSSGYTTYKWKVDGSLKSETSSLSVDTTNWAIGATYTISLIAADDSGNEDSYFAQITVTE